MSIEQLGEEMRIAIVGHVDHGKSTIIGRLLADTGSLPEGKLEQVKETCRRNSKPFEYAFLLDALKDEQAQGITIDVARCFFKSKKRNYLILDAPGHVEFIKNMVTGAAQADAAIMVIDALEGIQANSLRHGYMLSLLGIQQVIVLVNKMDLVGYNKQVFDQLREKFSIFLDKMLVCPLEFIPVSGRNGDNIILPSENIRWYHGNTLLEILDLTPPIPLPIEKDFRMPVQAVYKFTQDGDKRRIVAGTVDSGKLKSGDEVVFYPSEKRSRVLKIESLSSNDMKAEAGHAIGFTLEEQIYVKRGDVVAIAGEKSPHVATRMRTKIFWLGKEPLQRNKEYTFRLGTAKATAIIENIMYAIDISKLDRQEQPQTVEKYRAAECIIKTDKPLAFDLAAGFLNTSRFVLVDDYDIAGGGIIQEALSARQSGLCQNIARKNECCDRSYISFVERIDRLNQKPAMILLAGSSEARRKDIAKALERKLFYEGKFVHYLNINNLLHRFGADIKNKRDNKEEYLYRLAETACLMLDAGLLLITTVQELNSDNIRLLTTTMGSNKIFFVLVGHEMANDLNPALYISDELKVEEAVLKIKKLLQKRGIIFKKEIIDKKNNNNYNIVN